MSFLCEQANKFSIEIIVSNSPETTDATPNVCKNFSNLHFINSQKKGRAAQMNFGAKQATGEILLFLHADVELPTNFYLEVTNAIKNGYKAGFFAYQFDKETRLLNLNSSFTKKDGFFAGGGDQCQFFIKETFQKLRGYNEDFCIMEDFEMMDRVRKEKIP